MNLKSVLANLYYLLIYADGKINDREVVLGKKMMAAEGMDEVALHKHIDLLKTKDKGTILKDSIASLRKLDSKQQVRCIAWLCVVANSDGFMDKEEWMFIYKIYHTELKLSLDEIMKTQKDLNKIIHGRSFHSLGVIVD
ncbi:MAG: TerB family tellurite resistance protein [Bacteroidota bacterium]